MNYLRRGFRLACLVLTPLILITTVFVGFGSSNLKASSHREAPLISKDPSVDNTDVYAFVSPDATSTVTLISNWIPFEEPAGGPNFYHFDDNAYYYIRVDRDGDALPDISYRWEFDTRIRNGDTFLYNTFPITSPNSGSFNYRQYYTVTVLLDANTTGTTLLGNKLMVPDNVGPRSLPNYEGLAAQFVQNAPGGIKEFTGQRDDPFYVDLGSIFDLGGLRPFNGAHILPLPTAPGIDALAGYNIHTTALQVPISTLAPACTPGMPFSDARCVIGVWSTAERPSITIRSAGQETVGPLSTYVQVSRLGNPLVNEVVMSLDLKDIFNAVPPSVDSTVPAVVDRVNNPELAELIPFLYSGVITQTPPTPRTDLFTVFLTGIPGITQQVNSDTSPSEQLRLNVRIPPNAAGVCRGAAMGAMDGDLAGFPNGRRLEDDVTDIAIRAVAGGYGDFLEGALMLPNFSPNNILGDGVNKNDRPCLAAFPYMGTPHDGYYRIHAALRQQYLPIILKMANALTR